MNNCNTCGDTQLCALYPTMSGKCELPVAPTYAGLKAKVRELEAFRKQAAIECEEKHKSMAKVRELKGLLTRYAVHVEYHEGVNFLSDVYQNGNGNCLSDDQRYEIQELLKEGESDE